MTKKKNNLLFQLFHICGIMWSRDYLYFGGGKVDIWN